MKKIYLLLLILLGQYAYSGSLNAYLYMAQFKSPTTGAYIESYLDIMGNSVKFEKQADGTFQSKIQVLYLFKQNGVIKTFEKYILESPKVTDTISSYPNFTDVQRMAIENGIYNFELKIQDLYDTANVFTYQNIVTISMNETVQFSDIELIESYKESIEESQISKNGLDMVPYVSSFYPDHLNTLTFYAEVYNTEKQEEYLLQYYIQESSKGENLDRFSKAKKIDLKAVYPIVSSFDITDLKTGNYNLILNLRNRENKVIAEKIFFFQRYKKSENIAQDTLYLESLGITELRDVNNVITMKDYIKSLFPILNQRELYQAQNALNSNDIQLMKAYFNNYWNTTSQQPEQDWAVYKANVEKVNLSYHSQIKRGYETDRGRVYLKYGPPSDINSSEHEPSTYPYEIWQYFEINGETNKRFVFYNPDLVGSDFQLLHSDVKGEMSNPYWQKELTKRNSTTPNNFDDRNGESQYGNRSRDLFNR